MSDAGTAPEGAGGGEEAAEEEIDYDALPLNSSDYWAHFYWADEEPDFYEVCDAVRLEVSAAAQ